jgi:hypothetical protein
MGRDPPLNLKFFGLQQPGREGISQNLNNLNNINYRRFGRGFGLAHRFNFSHTRLAQRHRATGRTTPP